MSKANSKTFDCVENMRKTRDEISKEIGTLDHDGLIRWLRSYTYSDPYLRRLADRAVRREPEPGR